MTFDTTASNTGHVTAACVSIQKRLGRALLWSACRHHIGEVMLSHVFEDLHIEASKSPDVTLFSRFRKNFEVLLPMITPTTAGREQRLSRFDIRGFNDSAQTLVESFRDNVLQIATSELSFRRDDYLEFVELCILFLGTELANLSFTFKRPGALHKARWMAKLIYSIKICLLETHIQELP